MQKWIIKKFHFIGCNLYLLPDMRQSQLLYISAVTIRLLRNGIEARGISQAEYAPQSLRPATVAGACKVGPYHPRQLYFTCRTYKVNDAFLFAM